ncbi:TetR/AcrR family transcriptional regulator [Zavarzinia sp.]|uniref:TetR/AcrR family transcriptional regulator n=1 Tax=Zavarzinia sp. TaxID=2027920 RepID=UPI00356AC6E8
MAVSKRDLILHHAAACFAAQGLGATMNDIAEAAGVSRRTLYNHFPSRDAVLSALVERQSLDFLAHLAAVVPPAADFPGFVLECCCAIIRESPKQPLALLHLGNEAGRAATALHFGSPRLIEAWLGFFGPPYVEALRRGEIDAAITLPELLAWVGRIVTSFLQVQLPGEDEAGIRAQIERFFIRSLRPAGA